MTMTFSISADRLHRLPFHFDRWKGNISIAVRLEENQLKSVFKTISKFSKQNIRYTFQVIPSSANLRRGCEFYFLQNETYVYEDCFEVNLLRNFAIETIKTTHFMTIDADAIVSGKARCIVFIRSNIRIQCE